MKRVFDFTALAFACVLGLASSASAQSLITWDASVPMYDGETVQTFVNADGVLAYSANMDSRVGQADVTLNGVLFPTTNLAGLATLAGPSGVMMSTTIPSETGASYQDGTFFGDVDIFGLIATGIFSPGDVTFSGLTEGQTYEIQVFVNDARGGRHTGFVCLLSNGVDALTVENAAACKHSNRISEEGVPAGDWLGEPSGDSITGTFVAGAAGTQTFSVNGSTDGGLTLENGGRAQINGIQLRDVTDVTSVILGDCDMNGVVNFLDISPFISILSAGNFVGQADCNEDGVVSFLDISPFITILAGS